MQSARAVPEIPDRSVGDDLVRAVVACVPHPQRLEDTFHQEGVVGFAAHLAHDHAEQDIARVAVRPFLAGREVERCLDRRPDDRLRRGVIGEVPAQISEIVLDAGRVRQQMSNRDVLPGVGCALHEPADFILQADLAVLHQRHDGDRHERLGSRGQLVDGLRPGRHVQFDACVAVPSGFDDLAIADHCERQTGYMLPRHAGLDVEVHVVGVAIAWRRVGRRCRRSGPGRPG